ncbi:hypothetical protein [Streptomyces cucumeris]|uniref:hypothetical protein n=1 Tax=Streptomyces cucumeris TaxID=2962890 RepID=UPI003EB9A088
MFGKAERNNCCWIRVTADRCRPPARPRPREDELGQHLSGDPVAAHGARGRPELALEGDVGPLQAGAAGDDEEAVRQQPHHPLDEALQVAVRAVATSSKASSRITGMTRLSAGS